MPKPKVALLATFCLPDSNGTLEALAESTNAAAMARGGGWDSQRHRM